MPSFCRHNRLIQNCPICAREQDVEMRPVVSPGGHPPARETSGPASTRTSSPARDGGRTRRSSARSGRGGTGVTVRRLVREADDGYSSPLVPGLRSRAAAQRLAEELAFATARLATLQSDPPGLYAEVADPAGDIEERTWLAFQIAYLGPLQGDDPFAAIAAARTSWERGQPPALDAVQPGPRSGYDAARASRAIDAYRAWAGRTGSQAAAFSGEAAWTPERRFDRVFERLGAAGGLARAARFDLLVTLGRLGVYELRGGKLHVGGGDPVTLAAKRILGIGDPLLLERRAADLAQACGLDLEALDLGFDNWERGERLTMGLSADTPPDEDALAAALDALGLD